MTVKSIIFYFCPTKKNRLADKQTGLAGPYQQLQIEKLEIGKEISEDLQLPQQDPSVLAVV